MSAKGFETFTRSGYSEWQQVNVGNQQVNVSSETAEALSLILASNRPKQIDSGAMNSLIFGLAVLLIYSSSVALTKAPDALTETAHLVHASEKSTRVYREYDRFEDRTRYWTSALPVLVEGKIDRSLTVLSFFHFRGKGAGNSIERLGLVFFSSSSDFRYTRTAHLYAIVDSQRIEIGAPITNERDVERDGVKESLSFSVPYKTMRRIADGKHVEMRLGLTEFQLSELSLSDLKALLAKIQTVPIGSERKTNRRKQ